MYLNTQAASAVTRSIVLAGMALVGATATPASAASITVVPRVDVSPSPLAPARTNADFRDAPASVAAHQVANWVVASGDNRRLPFMIVDKIEAQLFLFDADGDLRATSPVLLGFARGDDTPPGIGDRPLALILPEERVTPAGRFVAEQGHNLSGKDILWIDYDAAVSLHRATDRKPGLTAKSRLDRLNSADRIDNRISHGCVNVSTTFYDRFIKPTTRAIVYILPETRSAALQFNIPSRPLQTQVASDMPGA